MKIALILIAVLFAFGGAYLYFQGDIRYYVFHYGMPPGYCDPGPCLGTAQNTSSSQLNTQGLPTKDIVTCINKNYGFELAYPVDWKIWHVGAPAAYVSSCSEVQHVYGFGPDIDSHPFQNQINLSINSWKGTLDSYIAQTTLKAKSETRLSGERLVWVKLDSRFIPETERMYAYHNGEIYEFDVYAVDTPTLNNFLLSFKFTSATSSSQ